jgi:hypothetical protein
LRKIEKVNVVANCGTCPFSAVKPNGQNPRTSRAAEGCARKRALSLTSNRVVALKMMPRGAPFGCHRTSCAYAYRGVARLIEGNDEGDRHGH